MLNKNAISINFTCSSPEEAIAEAGRLLHVSGVANEKYSDAMIESFKSFGAYFVISENIAMPHARPEQGAIGTGFSVVTLSDNVVFGNEDFDPVKVIIGLAAKDSDAHIHAITFLANLFEDDDTLTELRNASSQAEILKIFK